MVFLIYLVLPADRTGLEPATSAVTGRHSNQLNYRSIIFKVGKDTLFFETMKKNIWHIEIQINPMVYRIRYSALNIVQFEM